MCTVANEFGNDSREITVDSGELCLYMPSLFTTLVLEQKHRYGAHSACLNFNVIGKDINSQLASSNETLSFSTESLEVIL